MHKYFQKLGFSETQIRNVVLTWPNILFFSCANKTFKPKVDFFKEQLGVEDPILVSSFPVILGIFVIV